MEDRMGRIHSFQSLGTLDGPGLRYVVFMQGCSLRCIYCHNPDTWSFSGEEYSVSEVMKKILRCRPYWGENGGVTVSGGEPLLQWEFVAELFQQLHEKGVHTALDTAGAGDLNGAEKILQHTDLVLCDLKFSDLSDYRRYCGGDLNAVLSFLTLSEAFHVPLWIRHVVVPGLTDSPKSVLNISRIASMYSNLQKLELLPFRKLCIPKYEALGIPFPLSDYDECKDSVIQELTSMFSDNRTIPFEDLCISKEKTE